MTKVKKILITGDDGYNSIGIRLVVRALKDKYDLQIVATKKQQSGMGGKINLNQELQWGKDKVDEIDAIWIDGSPVDSVEFALKYFGKNSFDLIISGANLGSNVSNALISSGTFSVAFRALSIELAKKAIVMNIKSKDKKNIFKNHNHLKDSLKEYLDYPGKWIDKVLNLVIEENLWGEKLLNINLPKTNPKGIRFASIEANLHNYYQDPVKINADTMIYKATKGEDKRINENDTSLLTAGFITISPCVTNFLDKKALERLKNQVKL